jgi:hypothetical protein
MLLPPTPVDMIMAIPRLASMAFLVWEMYCYPAKMFLPIDALGSRLICAKILLVHVQ